MNKPALNMYNSLPSSTWGRHDVKPKVRIEFEKIRKKKSTHGWAHGWSHDRAVEAETAF